MTVVWWVQGADRERALTALPAANPSRAEFALRFFRRRGEGSTGSTPLVGGSGGGGRRRGAGQPRGRARVARRRAAGVHPSRARDASARRGSSEGSCANGDGDVPRSGRSRGREAHGGGCR